MKLLSPERFSDILNQYSKLSPLMIIGDVGVDKYTQGEVKRISPEAPVPVLNVRGEWEKLGLAANISHNLKTLGVNSTLCGVVGEDLNATRFENLLEACELKTWGIVRDDTRLTTFKERVVTPTQQICRIDYESGEFIGNKTQKLLLDRINDFSSSHGAVILEDYAKGTLEKDFVREVIKKLRSENKIVAVDPGREINPRYYSGATLLKPNFEEAGIMVGDLTSVYDQKNVREMARILSQELEIEKIVITLGKEGMAFYDSDSGDYEVIPTVASEVFDVSGAGDTAISLLVASLEAGASLRESVWMSNCGSGVVVAKRGTATVDIDELRQFYQRLQARYEQK